MSYTIPSDTHAPGDAGHTVDHNNMADVLKGMGAVANVQNTAFAGGADPTGGADSTAAIQAALLSFGTLTSWSQGQGGTVYVPPGIYTISKTLVIPSGVRLAGAGWASQITLATDSKCDMIQTATYNSSSQAALCGVSAGSIRNAFYAGAERLALHGDSFHATQAAYFHGINVTTSPTTSTGPGDPDFDPCPVIRDVWIKACTGDGYYHSGRSGALLERVLVQYCNGNGFSPGFDTTLVDCLAESCCAGFYFNHASVTGAGCKSFNNLNLTCKSGASYSPNSFGGSNAVAIDPSDGLMYFCILATSGTTQPHLDAAHWTAVSATSPAATGTGYYWDTNAAEHCWAAADAQQNSGSSYYLKGPHGTGSAIIIQGASSDPNFNNGEPSFDTANPRNYAHVTLDGVTGCTVQVSANGTAALHQSLVTELGSPSGNMVTATTDGTETTVFNGGTPAFALVNAKLYSSVDVAAAGQGLKVAEGSNAKQGTAVLAAGSAVVSNTSVTASSRIFLTSNADGGTPGWLRVSARTAGTSFTITSSSGTDTSTVAYEIFEPG